MRPIEVDENSKIISHVLHDIVDEFFIKEQMEFEIIIFRHLPDSTVEIIDEFLATRYERFLRSLKLHIKLPDAQKYVFMWSSAIIFLTSIEDIFKVEIFYYQRRRGDEAIKYFIYIPNLTYSQLETSKIWSTFKHLTALSDFLIEYSFFIIDEPETVTLSTIEWFSDKKCQNAQLKKVNSFDKKSMMWNKKLENYEKFLEYNGCELVLMVTVPIDGVISDVSNYAYVNDNQTNFEVHGIVSQVFEIAAKTHNFSASYQPAIVQKIFLLYLDEKYSDLVSINGTGKIPSVYFRIAHIFHFIRDFLKPKTTHAFVDTSFRISVTPGELYTSYEKLFLPFDLETWIMLVVTFLTTFLSILIINRLSKSAQNIVYGHKVYTPFWNVVSIFFGISLTKLPSKNFSRFILILFIFFCLIFRTCYQSKLFEFMTSEPRRPPPKTIEDCIEKGFILYLMEENRISDLFDIYGDKLDLRFSKIRNFYKLFLTQSQNSSAKIALVMDEFLQNHLETRFHFKNDWNKFKEPFLVSHDTFEFHPSAFHFRMFNQLINRLIDTGVMKYLSDNYYTKTPKFDPIVKGPKVLSLDDMMFGFNIWLGFCAISFAGFLGEIIFKMFRNKLKNLVDQEIDDESGSVSDVKVETNEELEERSENLENQTSSECQKGIEVNIHEFSGDSGDDENETKELNVKKNEPKVEQGQNCESKTPELFVNLQNFDEIEEIVELENLIESIY